MKRISLTKGYVTVVDDDDFEEMSRYSWHVTISKNARGEVLGVYAQRHGEQVNGVRAPMILMHRAILGITDPKIEVDHWNHKTLDNRKKNLRVASTSDNQRNRTLSTNNNSGKKGVSWHAVGNKWQVHITIDGKTRYLGLYSSLKDASERYDRAAREHFGQFALTNRELA